MFDNEEDDRGATGFVRIIPNAEREYADELDLSGTNARNNRARLAIANGRRARRRRNRRHNLNAIETFVAEGEYVEPSLPAPAHPNCRCSTNGSADEPIEGEVLEGPDRVTIRIGFDRHPRAVGTVIEYSDPPMKNVTPR